MMNNLHRTALVFLLLLLALSLTPAWADSPMDDISVFQSYLKSVKVQTLTRTLSRERVKPGETFYADIELKVSLVADLSIGGWKPTAQYQVVGINEAGDEVLLGSGERTIDFLRDRKAGEVIELSEHIPLVFPVDAALGNYRVVVKPTGVKEPLFKLVWPVVNPLLPKEVSLGKVELVSAEATVIPQLTPQPTSALPSPTPAPTTTPIPDPTPTPVSPTPTLPVTGNGILWLLPWLAACGATTVITGIIVCRRNRFSNWG